MLAAPMPAPQPTRPRIWTWSLLAGLIAAGHAAWLARGQLGTLLDILDTGTWPFLGHYFRTHLEWRGVPVLAFESDASGFPFGMVHAMMPWAFEREYFYALLSSLFGPVGPWHGLYFLLSCAIVAAGTARILAGVCGPRMAALLGCAASVFNFYALTKYPYHLNIACVHWTVLGLVADARITQRLAAEGAPPLTWALGRGALLIAAMGLDLGYVAPLALTSLTLHAPVWLWLGWRRGVGRAIFPAWRLEAAARPWACIGLLAVAALAAYAYLPLIVGLLFAAPQGLVDPVWSGVSLGRIIVPYLPGVQPELQGGALTPFDLRPGGFLLLIAGAGLWSGARRSLRPLLLSGLGLLLVFVLHGSGTSLLALLPWHAHSRVPTRVTLALPALLAILGAGLAPRELVRRWWLGGALAVAAGIELWTLHTALTGRPPAHDPAVAAYLTRIAALPGEAGTCQRV